MKAPAIMCAEFVWALDNLAYKSLTYELVEKAFNELWINSKAMAWAAENDHPRYHE